MTARSGPDEPQATLAGQRHAIAVIAVAMPALAVILDTPLGWLILGSITIPLASFAASEIRASRSFTGLGLTRVATLCGSVLLLLAVVSFVRDALTSGGSMMAAIRAWGGTLSWATAVVALALKGIDRVLTKDQKAKLADVVLGTWNWLDDQRRANYPKLLWKEPTQKAMLWLSASLFLFFQAVGVLLLAVERLADDAVLVAGVVLTIGFGIIVARSAYRREHVAVMRRILVASSISAYFTLLVGAVISYSPYWVLPVLLAVARENIPRVRPLAMMLLLPSLVTLWPVFVRRNTEAVLLGLVFVLSLLFLTLTMYARILFHAAERVVAIVLEHKDGVVVGVSALLIAIGAVLKLIP